MLEKTTRMNLLFDLYGDLLSDKQKLYMQLYYLDDLSLGEIAEEVEVSRQAVYDQIRRAEAQLETFEEKMQLLKKASQREQLYRELEGILTPIMNSSVLASESHKVEQILNSLREID
jgi:predicted DNA-binding protein YlxM (UPF0122 family)